VSFLRQAVPSRVFYRVPGDVCRDLHDEQRPAIVRVSGYLGHR
jgi:hypothetical protein